MKSVLIAVAVIFLGIGTATAGDTDHPSTDKTPPGFNEGNKTGWDNGKPPGWDEGNKEGWDNKRPPGLESKEDHPNNDKY